MKLSPTRLLAVLAAMLLIAQGHAAEPTLKQITAEPDWIARSPRNPRWLVDGSAIRFSQRRPGLVGRDFTDDYLIFRSNPDAQPAKITPENPGPYFLNAGDWNTDHSRRLLTRGGDLFLYNSTTNSATQLTQTADRESSAFFLTNDTAYAFSRDGVWIIRSLDDPWEFQAADIRFADAPKDEQDDPEYTILEQEQRDLFDIVNLHDQREAMRFEDTKAWRDTDPTAVPGPFYMGKDKRPMGDWLSPSGDFIIVATAPKARPNDKRDIMPNYVTDDGYISTQSVRPKVGNQSRSPISLALLDLKNERIIELPLDDLPTIKADPLAWIKEPKADEPDTDKPDTDKPEADESKSGESESDTSSDQLDTPRPVSLLGVRWSDSGRFAAVMLRSHDNKDRWITLIDNESESPEMIAAHHLHDDAWINWDFNEFGFIPGSDTLWYLSEESNYAHLSTRAPDGTITQHTSGPFEVRDIRFTHDGSTAYLRSNRTHPGIEELEALDLSTNTLTPMTSMGGTIESYRLSPDESQAIITYSNINSPPELYLIDLKPNATPRRLTHTITDAFTAMHFQTPKIVPIPSSHTEQPIYTRVYLPDSEKFPGKRPLIVFSHGAGYLQHANYEWSYYFREHMFHTILTNEGFIVVAPDFRASAGYGRNWRTAIYRQMGYKELEDFKDTIDYAVTNYNADPTRVGIYGGSYGGFMTLMAMFLEPETYTCGAALRSVTDWRHYNHGYTSNILNTPEIDPEAYDISSPINHAEGLQGHLLMLHGLQDDNVVAQDIIRLSQRLIELEKQNWELALAPIEPHGYHEPSSWLDQMRRIHKLFRDELAHD
ncbi:MAG: prolyl oligopeptidase family serine peptidase [Phycisphaerales bacterium]